MRDNQTTPCPWQTSLRYSIKYPNKQIRSVLELLVSHDRVRITIKKAQAEHQNIQHQSQYRNKMGSVEIAWYWIIGQGGTSEDEAG